MFIFSIFTTFNVSLETSLMTTVYILT